MDEEAIFTEALEIPTPERRAAYLSQACAGDPGLRRKVEELLLAHAQGGNYLDAAAAVWKAALPTCDHLPSTELPGSVIGQYKLLEQIGEGGMGLVFVAEQERPVRRRVALKVIKPGMDTRQVVARFEAERQALALMDHANIAKVFDGGATPEGRPYFVMELVRGTPITDYCDQHRLPTRRRLELFLDVCSAVQHAHQKGIIHRDLKPSNVLVSHHDVTPVAKVIDFGIAKAIAGRLTEKTVYTAFAQMIGTPLYVSPEQAGLSDLDVDTRSDVYSLGVMLYELLTGSTPFDAEALKKVDFDEMRRIIREDEPPRPSARVSTLELARLSTVAERRSLEPRRLSQQLRGELDWVVMKALEKDRDRRYESASALAADVGRYLADEPVQACPPSAWYRFRKFARRNKAALATSLVIALAVVLGGGAVGWVVRSQDLRRLEAEGRVAEALEVAEPLLREGKPHHPELVSAARKVDAQLATASVSLELKQRVQQMRADLAMLTALEQARLACSAVTENKFDLPAGMAAYAQAFRDYGIDVAKLSPDDAAAAARERTIALHLAAALDDWALMLLHGRNPKEAGPLLAVARLVDPDTWRNRLRAALEAGDRVVLDELARDAAVDGLPVATSALLGKQLLAVRMRQEAVDLLTRAHRRHPGDFWINHDLGMALMLASGTRLEEAVGRLRTAVALQPQSPGARLNLGYVLEKSGRLDDAIAEYREAVRLKPDYDAAHGNLGSALLDRGRPKEAVAPLQEAIRLRPGAGRYHTTLGKALREADRLDEAIAAFREAIRLLPGQEASGAYTELGSALLRQGSRDEALGSVRKALALEEELVARSPGDAQQRHGLAGAQNNVAMVLMDHGEHGEAEALLRRAIATERELAEKAPANRDYRDYLANMHQNLGELHLRQEKQAEGEAELGTALDHRKRLVAEAPQGAEYRARLASTHDLLARLLTRQKRHEEGDANYAEAIRVLKLLVADSRAARHRSLLAEALHHHAVALRERGKPAEAQREWEQAVALWKELVVEFPSADEYKKRHAEARKHLLAGMGLSAFVDADPNILKDLGSLAFGPDRNGDGVKDLYVAGRSSDNVVVYDGKTGAFIEEFAGRASGLVNCAWLTFGPNGDLFVPTNLAGIPGPQKRDAVVRIDQKTKTVTRFVSKDNPGGNGGLLGAKGIAFGPDGHFYVASSTTAQILRFNGSTGRFMGVFVDAGSGGLNDPAKVIFGPDRNNDKTLDLYVSNTNTNEVLVYSGVDGSPLGAFVTARSGGLQDPLDMTFGPDGHLYVAKDNTDNPMVSRFDGVSGAFMDVVISAELGPALSFIAFDSAGDLYVTKDREREVLRYRRPKGERIQKPAR